MSIERKKKEEDFVEDMCKQAIQMSLIQPEEKMQFGAFISAAIPKGRRQALEEVEKSISKIPETHAEDCEYQRHGCDCGYVERVAYNRGIDAALNAIANLAKK